MHNINLFTRDEAEAHRRARDGKLQQIEYAALVGGAGAQAAMKYASLNSAPVEECIEEWLEEMRMAGCSDETLSAYRKATMAWGVRVGVLGFMVSNITPAHIDQFINAPDETAFATKQLRLTCLRLFFARQVKKNRLLVNPCDEVGIRRDLLTQKQMIKRVTHSFTEEEWKRLNEAAQEWPLFWRFLLVFGRDTSFRFRDIVNMEVVNLDAGVIRVSPRKTARQVEIPITPLMQQVLDSIAVRSGVFLFPEEQRIYHYNGPYWFSSKFRRLKQLAGVTKGSLRSLRKMGAGQEVKIAKMNINDMIEQYALKRAAAKLGHSTTTTTRKHYLD